MSIPKFDPSELKVVEEVPDSLEGSPVAVYNTPISAKEAGRATFQRKPVWQILGSLGVEFIGFIPRINPDNIARAFIMDALSGPGGSNPQGGKDMFGIEWEYIPVATGSMVRPGKPYIKNAREIKDKIVFPDLDSWDWEGSRKNNEIFLSQPKYYYTMLFNGWFERVISFMDFKGAILAMINEDQKDAIKAFFDELSDFYIRLLDKYIAYYPEIDLYILHDDWGSQKDTFFAPAVVKEMIVPYMRRVTDFLHSKGKIAELHSCGHIIKQVPNMIEAGFDAWNPQSMNDFEKIYNLYGDKILVATLPEYFNAEKTSEEEQRAIARTYADKYCNPDKPSYLSIYAAVEQNLMTPAFREELYKQSRINYSK